MLYLYVRMAECCCFFSKPAPKSHARPTRNTEKKKRRGLIVIWRTPTALFHRMVVLCIVWCGGGHVAFSAITGDLVKNYSCLQPLHMCDLPAGWIMWRLWTMWHVGITLSFTLPSRALHIAGTTCGQLPYHPWSEWSCSTSLMSMSLSGLGFEVSWPC